MQRATVRRIELLEDEAKFVASLPDKTKKAYQQIVEDAGKKGLNAALYQTNRDSQNVELLLVSHHRPPYRDEYVKTDCDINRFAYTPSLSQFSE